MPVSKCKMLLSACAILSLLGLTLAEAQETATSSAAEAVPESIERPPFALGVSVSDSPGVGVLAQVVAWGSPADRAGIRSGDFLMAINGESIEKPADLKRQLKELAAKKELDVTCWRNGDTLKRVVRFDARFSDATREKAWLGVMLQMTEGGKVLIADVLPTSPAEESGIRIGDSIIRINAESIDSMDELRELMRRLQSGDNVEVTVLRNGQEQTFTIRVGSAVQRTMRWFRDRIPFEQVEGWRDRVPEIEVDRYMESFENMMDRLQREVDDLRNEVERLRGSKDTAKDGATEATDAESTVKTISSIDTSHLPAVYANEDGNTRSYADYRGGRPQVRYRYPRRYYVRNYRAYPPRVYYYAPAFRYPTYVYPRTPNMMYFGPAVRVTYGPWVYAY